MSFYEVNFHHHDQLDFLNDGHKIGTGGVVDTDEGVGYYHKDMISDTSYMIPKIHDGIIPMVHFKISEEK